MAPELKIHCPPGKYVVGDLAYVFEPEEWEELTSGIDYDSYCWASSFRGTPIAMIPTAYGDGIFADQGGKEYPVDSASIGAAPTHLFSSERLANVVEWGSLAFVTFDEPFDCFYDDGILVFGDIKIDTTKDAWE